MSTNTVNVSRVSELTLNPDELERGDTIHLSLDPYTPIPYIAQADTGKQVLGLYLPEGIYVPADQRPSRIRPYYADLEVVDLLPDRVAMRTIRQYTELRKDPDYQPIHFPKPALKEYTVQFLGGILDFSQEVTISEPKDTPCPTGKPIVVSKTWDSVTVV